MSSITDIKDPNGPPSLPSYSAGVQVNGQYFVPPHPVAPPGSEYVLVRKRSPAKRFLRATFAALFLWILLKMSVHSVVDMVNREHWHHGWSDSELPIPDNIKLGKCISGDLWSELPTDHSRYPLAARVHFNFPLSDSALSLIARGALSAGSVNVMTDPNLAKDRIEYQVTVRYFKDEIRDLAEVCEFSAEDTDYGVGIFTPSHRPYPSRGIRDTMFFETLITLPDGNADSPISVKIFKTDVPNTSQHFADMAAKILFESIDVGGTNAPIEIESINAIDGNIHTSNGPIRGVFNTTSSLEIKTSNSPIQVAVGLTSLNDGPEPKLVMRTRNSPLEGEISLLQPSSSSSLKSVGIYHVDAETSNSRLGLAFATAPVGSTLTLNAATSNSPANVALHPTFEGDFDLSTSNWFKALVVEDEDVQDPSGKDRKRDISYNRVDGQHKVVGKVFWGEDGNNKADGVVKVHTSNSGVVLKL